jgi:hypothetical protein
MKTSPLWFQQADDALLRAAQRAREVAKRTGTSIHVIRDGRIVTLTPIPEAEGIVFREEQELKQKTSLLLSPEQGKSVA